MKMKLTNGTDKITVKAINNGMYAVRTYRNGELLCAITLTEAQKNGAVAFFRLYGAAFDMRCVTGEGV